MSDDIVERLLTAKGSVRHGPLDDGSYGLSLLNNVDLCHEAADEIERLRAVIATTRHPDMEGRPMTDFRQSFSCDHMTRGFRPDACPACHIRFQADGMAKLEADLTVAREALLDCSRHEVAPYFGRDSVWRWSAVDPMPDFEDVPVMSATLRRLLEKDR